MTTLSLTNIAKYPLAEIDKFFAALRIVTGYETGYAQILFFPHHWTFDYYVNLPLERIWEAHQLQPLASAPLTFFADVG